MKYIHPFSKLIVLSALVTITFFSPVQAKDKLDGYLCSFAKIFECSRLTDCQEIALSDAQIPDHILVNPDQEPAITSAPGSQFNRSASIKYIDSLEKVLALHGTQNGQVWTIAIDKKSNRMTGVSTDGYLTFSLFGYCTKLSDIK